MHRTGELYGHFETLEQQKESASLGMWIFLITEVMFFGGLFLCYVVYRHYYFPAFSVGSNMLDLTLGGFNTVVLLSSSFTMAMAVWAAQVGKKQLISLFLVLTILLGFGFLGVKVIEYKSKFEHHLVPGKSFDLYYRANNPQPGDNLQDLQIEREELDRAAEEGRSSASQSIEDLRHNLNAHAQLYFSLYFGMTGLHALHMIIGAGLLFWLLAASLKGRFTVNYNTPVDNIGLYWHFVDIIWIYLFPLLYLIDRHR